VDASNSRNYWLIERNCSLMWHAWTSSCSVEEVEAELIMERSLRAEVGGHRVRGWEPEYL
jgi:hypothetical protein